MELTRLIKHIRKTLTHTLYEHQYGIVDGEKNASIVTAMVNYLQGLHDTHHIHDFVLSVINISNDEISVSIAVKHSEDGEFVLIPATLRTRFESQSNDEDFDRAMRGV